jgi:thiol-disulfide isomerase/thioredoxin
MGCGSSSGRGQRQPAPADYYYNDPGQSRYAGAYNTSQQSYWTNQGYYDDRMTPAEGEYYYEDQYYDRKGTISARAPAVWAQDAQEEDDAKGGGGGEEARSSRNIFEDTADLEFMNEDGYDMVGMPDFKESLRNAIDRLVIVLFYEDDCEDCYAMRELYQEFVLMYPKVLFLEANVKANSEAIKALRIKFLPTFIAFKNHLEVGRLVDVDAQQLEALIAGNS